MRNYAVHLLFHVLTIVVGFAAGVAGALWWDNRDERMLWLAAGAAVVGILALALQALYISGSSRPRQARRTPTEQPRTAAESSGPIAPAPASGTRVQPGVAEEPTEEATRRPAAEALKAYEARERLR